LPDFIKWTAESVLCGTPINYFLNSRRPY